MHNGIRLKRFRENNHLTQKDIKDRLGIPSDSTISYWETGKREIPDYMLDLITQEYHLDKNYFVRVKKINKTQQSDCTAIDEVRNDSQQNAHENGNNDDECMMMLSTAIKVLEWESSCFGCAAIASLLLLIGEKMPVILAEVFRICAVLLMVLSIWGLKKDKIIKPELTITFDGLKISPDVRDKISQRLKVSKENRTIVLIVDGISIAISVLYILNEYVRGNLDESLAPFYIFLLFILGMIALSNKTLQMPNLYKKMLGIHIQDQKLEV